jgi:hypothetical protein
MFRGITILEHVKEDLDRVAIVNSVVSSIPVIESWWTLFPHLQREHLTGTNMTKSNKSFLWVARPPGIWVVITRYQNELIANNGFIPIEADWEKFYEMLKGHGVGLICRASQEVGLVPVFVQAPGEEPTPLAPGFAPQVQAINQTSVLDIETDTSVQSIEEQEVNWPDGIVKPYIIGLDSARVLMDEENRIKLVEKHQGIWLLAPNEPVYEVR